MFLFPAIDLRGGQVVRLHQGDYEQQTTYAADPVRQALQFEREGASWLHLVDLDGARSGRMGHLEVIRRICAETRLRVEVGGGVRDEAVIDSLLAAGAARVVLGTAALRNWSWFESLPEREAYRGRLVLGLDAKHGKLAVAGWREQTEATPLDIARRVSGWPLAAIVYTDISTDGTLQGPNLPATEALARATTVPVVASGGVGSLDHLRALRQLPIQGAIVGKALYEACFTVREGVAVMEQGA